MDVTPEQLRAPGVKEAFRGYHQTQVDLLLERAAATIEKLMGQLQEPRAIAGSDVSGIDRETIQRTLILAQRTADDAVAEAQARAREILDESESKAKHLVDDADATARRIRADAERQLEAELEGLVERRDRLCVEADALERYASDYRARVWATIDADLAKIGVTIEPPAERPESSDVERHTVMATGSSH